MVRDLLVVPVQLSNIAAFRCFYCGARPPRRLRAEVAAQPHALKELVSGR